MYITFLCEDYSCSSNSTTSLSILPPADAEEVRGLGRQSSGDAGRGRREAQQDQHQLPAGGVRHEHQQRWVAVADTGGGGAVADPAGEVMVFPLEHSGGHFLLLWRILNSR